jgi:hypothetical protein
MLCRPRLLRVHIRARTAEETDWERIVLLYDALVQISLSPIVALNRAVAVGMAQDRPLDSMRRPHSRVTLRWLATICFPVFAETCFVDRFFVNRFKSGIRCEQRRINRKTYL